MEKQKPTVFDQLVEKRYGSEISKQPVNYDIDEDFRKYKYDFEAPRVVPDIGESVHNKGMALNQSPT